jgi:hypothetical protein
MIRKSIPDIITAAKEGGDPFYTNSSHLPVGYTEDIFKPSISKISSRPSIPLAPSSTPS